MREDYYDQAPQYVVKMWDGRYFLNERWREFGWSKTPDLNRATKLTSVQAEKVVANLLGCCVVRLP